MTKAIATAPVTVLMCVGPESKHQEFMDEALESVYMQTVAPDELLFVDDMANLTTIRGTVNRYGTMENVWRAPWNLGSVAAVNCGVSLARNDAVIILASDDWIDPGLVEKCMRVYDESKLAYYWFDIQHHGMYEERMSLPSGASMVTKKLWQYTGGVPYEACVGHPDSIFVSVMQVNMPEIEFVQVGALYHARIMEANDYYVRLRGGWNGTIDAVKNLCTTNWKKPAWGRME